MIKSKVATRGMEFKDTNKKPKSPDERQLRKLAQIQAKAKVDAA